MAGLENTNSSTAAAAAAAVSPVAMPGSPPSKRIVGVSLSAGDQSAVESSDDNAGNKKPAAWSKKPSPESEGGPGVMGAELWPALSESTKASPKLSPSNSAMNIPDLGSASAPPPQKPMVSNVNHNVTPNHGRTTRQKSMKHDGGGNAQDNGSIAHQPPLNYNSSVKNSSGGGSESSGRGNMPNHGYRELGARNPSGDHPHPRSSFRRGNGGPHPRGDGSHQNYGVRHGDQDRGSHDWNHQRNFNGRDASLQPRASPRGFVRPAVGSAPFVHPGGPAPVRPFMNPMAMPDMPMIYFPPGMPFIAPVPPPMYFPMPDPQLQAKIASQIDYYFSTENLIKDTFLRQNMDKDGWVAISLIASFKKVMQLTDNIQLILDAVRSNSAIVEVKADKIRRRNDYMRWIMPSSVEFSTGSGTPSPKSPGIFLK